MIELKSVCLLLMGMFLGFTLVIMILLNGITEDAIHTCDGFTDSFSLIMFCLVIGTGFGLIYTSMSPGHIIVFMMLYGIGIVLGLDAVNIFNVCDVIF